MWAGRQTAAPHGKRSDNGRSVEGAAPRSSWRRSGGDGGCAVMSTQQMWNFLMSEPQVVCQTCMMVTCVSCMSALGPPRLRETQRGYSPGRWGATARRMVANKILYDVACERFSSCF